jgi:hypothetical protein
VTGLMAHRAQTPTDIFNQRPSTCVAMARLGLGNTVVSDTALGIAPQDSLFILSQEAMPASNTAERCSNSKRVGAAMMNCVNSVFPAFWNMR